METDFGSYINLLCLDSVGELVVSELQGERTRWKLLHDCCTTAQGWLTCRLPASRPLPANF